MGRQLTEGQREVLSQLLHITLTGNGSAEEVGRLCGRLFELLTPDQRRELEHSMAVHRATFMLGALLTPDQRRELEHSMAVHRATLMLGALREMGYVT